MTDDFSLFQDQAGGDPVDPDIALVTAYLARELSLVQIAAVEERLANDTAFREKTLPILKAWALPAALPAFVPPALSREEVAAGWQRYVGEHAELDAHDGPRLVVEGTQQQRRKVSMIRIAAGVAAVVLPVITLAQITVYVSKKPQAPGHTLAKEMVAPFTEPPAPTLVPPPVKPLTTPVDVPVGRQLEPRAPSVQRAAPVQVPVIETPAPVVTEPPVWTANPDRAKIAGYATKHLPQVIRGDTVATYIVMVLDASDNYVWSTFGSGSLRLAIGGDKRTAAERSEANRAGALEYTGAVRSGGGGAGGGGRGRGAGGVQASAGGGIRARVPDSSSRALMVRDTTRMMPDSTLRRSIATSGVIQPDSAIRARVGAITATAGFGRGSGGSAAPAYGVADSTGAYALGFGRYTNGAYLNLNEAAGLQEPGNGESGIQGLKATSLTMGEQYLFGPGQLTSGAMRIFVVHLAPGTTWKGR